MFSSRGSKKERNNIRMRRKELLEAKPSSCFKKCIDDGELTVRTVLGLWAYPSMNDAKQIQKLKDLHTKNYNQNKCFLKIDEIKIYSDGIAESTTVSMLEPYVKNLHLHGLMDNIDMDYFTQDRLQKYFEQLPDFDFHIHAIVTVACKRF